MKKKTRRSMTEISEDIKANNKKIKKEDTPKPEKDAQVEVKEIPNFYYRRSRSPRYNN